MILPTKHIPAEQSFIGLGATLLRELDAPQSVSTLWEKIRNIPAVGTFERFITAIDMLFILGLVDFKNGKIGRVQT